MAAKCINYALAMSESCLKARARSNPHFLSYRRFVMATRVTFTHVEALFPQVPAGDSRLFNVPASIKAIYWSVVFFTDVRLFILRSRRAPTQAKFAAS